MSKTYQITPNRRLKQYQYEMQVGDAENIAFNFSSWVLANATVTACTWTLKSGDVSLGTPSLASNVSTCLITAASTTRARILIKATAGSQVVSQTLLIRVIEPKDRAEYNFGWIAP